MSTLPSSATSQMILLSHAAKTDTGSVFPLPAASWRSNGNIHFGLTITDAGKAAINLGDDDGTGDAETAGATPLPTTERKPRTDSKIARVLALLRRTQGATLAELVEATGWLPHTTRAALTGLKKGHVITKTKRNATTCYHIAGDN